MNYFLILEQSMPTVYIIGIVAIVLGFGLFLLGHFILNPKNKIGRSFKKSPPKPFYSVKEGEYVRLHGKVKSAEEELKSPLMQKPCAIYQFEVTTRKNNGDSMVSSGHDSCSFVMEDAEHEAKVIIKHKNAFTFHLMADLLMTNERLKVPRENYQNFVEKYKIDETDGLFNIKQRIDITERALCIGDTVAVKGVASWQVNTVSGKRELIIQASPSKKLLITDDPKVIKTISKSR